VTTSLSTAITPTSNSNGTYTVDHQLTAKDTYALTVQFGGVDLLNTPVANIIVDVGLVQAKKSQLVYSYTPILAG